MPQFSKAHPSPHAFRPGQSGNPAGRPALDPKLLATIKRALPHAVARTIEALDADRGVVVGQGDAATLEYLPDWETRIRAAAMLLDRVIGRPAQAVTGADGGPVQLATVDPTAFLRWLKKLEGDGAPSG